MPNVCLSHHARDALYGMKQGLKFGKIEIPHHGMLISVLLIGATFFLGLKSFDLQTSSSDAAKNKPKPVYLSATLKSCNNTTAEIELSWVGSGIEESYVVQKRIGNGSWIKIYETSGLYPYLAQEVNEMETIYQVTSHSLSGISDSNTIDTSSLLSNCQKI